MFTRGRIGEGWLGEMYAGEDVQGRPTRFFSLGDWSDAQRTWLMERMRLMNLYTVQGVCPQLGLQIIQGEPCWVGAWRDGVQLSVLLDEKHLPNTVIMSIAYGIIQSLHSAQTKGIIHGCLHPNGIWIGVDGQIWIDGYGQSIGVTDSFTDDVFVLGQLLVEMFLGECPFPVPADQHLQTLQEVGLELKAMGLPRKLPRQIMRLLHPEPNSRPTLDILSDKWKITRGASILSGWVRSQFPQIVEASRPEDRIPTARRIAPLPCPIVETVFNSPVVANQTTVEQDVLSDDDTLLRSRPESIGDEQCLMDHDRTHEDNIDEEKSAEDTLVLPEGQRLEEATEQVDLHYENTDEVVEETQVRAFSASVELEFFDDEPTSRLMVEDAFFSSDVEPVESLDLAEEMDTPSRRPLIGLLWIGVVGVLTVLGLYWTVPNIPSYPEDSVEVSKQMDETSQVVVEAIPILNEPVTDTVTPPVESSSMEEDVAEPEEAVISQRPNSTVKSSKRSVKQAPRQSTTVKKNPKVDAKPVSKQTKPVEPIPPSVAEKPPVKEELPEPEVVENTEDATAEPTTEPVTESTEPEVEIPPEPKVTTGTVKVNGDHVNIRFERDGRDIPMGTMETGAYTVYVTFEGFNEFKVTTFTVETGKVYTVNCNSMFATCQVK